ncbi:MAG: glycosyltransferase family 4 protein [Candidatus Altiarchaeota archaeon]|nr:glycosyltransferase family 4 protein [Candidatus Altiarchaeota archaeon]
MRVLFVSTDFPYRSKEGAMTQGGGGACIAQLAEGLTKKGIEVEVVTRKEPEMESELYGFPIYRTKFYNLGFRESKITHYFPATKECKRLLSEKKFDLIHTHNPTAGMTGCKVSKKFKIPHVMTLHGPWASVRQRFYTRSLARYIEKKTIGCADIVTCDSHALMKEVLENYNPPQEKVVAIPNAVDTAFFNPNIPKEEARKELSLRTEGPIVFYTGRFVEEKGLPYLLDAFKEIEGAHLLLLGGGFDEHLVKDWLGKNSRLKEKIHVIPYLPYPRMPLAYNACDIFVLPTLAEGMSRSIMEAMACGKAVVATNVGGNSELVSKETGILVEPKSPHALSFNIQKLLDKRHLRLRMGQVAREFALGNLSVEKRINSFIKVYGTLKK